MTARKYTNCSTCGASLPALKGNGRRAGYFYKWCSADCRRADRAGYWHDWYVTNVKSTKAVARAARAAAGFRAIERRP
jgi:hypothetical protein